MNQPVDPFTQPPTAAQGQAATLLRASLDSLIDESQALRTDVRAAEAQRARELARRRQENMVMSGLLGILSLLMLMMLTVAWQNNKISKDVRRGAAQLADCTTPGGNCYRQGQARTGLAIDDLQNRQLYIIECSRKFPTAEYPPGPRFDRLFETCVAARLAEARNHYPTAAPTPTPTATGPARPGRPR